MKIKYIIIGRLILYEEFKKSSVIPEYLEPD